MATTKPRVTISLDQEIYDTLRELASLQGCTLSGLIVEQLRLCHPVQVQVLDACRNLATVSDSARRGLALQLERSQASLDQALAPLLEVLGALSGTTVPPNSNTGVTLSQNTHPASDGAAFADDEDVAIFAKEFRKLEETARILEETRASDLQEHADMLERLAARGSNGSI